MLLVNRQKRRQSCEAVKTLLKIKGFDHSKLLKADFKWPRSEKNWYCNRAWSVQILRELAEWGDKEKAVRAVN